MDEVLHRALLSHPERVGRRGSKARHWRCLSWQGTDWGGVLILSKAQKSATAPIRPLLTNTVWTRKKQEEFRVSASVRLAAEADRHERLVPGSPMVDCHFLKHPISYADMKVHKAKSSASFGE